MLIVGNDELGEKLEYKYSCQKCGGEHEIIYGKKKLEDGTWIKTKMMSFYKCGDKTYLAGIDGRKLKLHTQKK